MVKIIIDILFHVLCFQDYNARIVRTLSMVMARMKTFPISIV
jgi:hypothetical protein